MCGRNLAGAVIDRDQRGREASWLSVGVLRHQPFQVGLRRRVEGQKVHQTSLVLPHLGVGQMRRKGGEIDR